MTTMWTTNVMARTLAALGVSAAMAAPSPAIAKQILPRDECLFIDGYFDFRQKLEDIIRKRDAPALAALTDDNISWSFGGGEGKQNFLKEWQFSKGAAATIWPEFDKIIRLGCGKSDPGIVFPYSFTVDFGTGDAGAGFGTIIGNGVNMRSAPAPTAPVIAKLNWDIIETIDQTGEGAWTKVKTSDGRTGFVKTEFTRGALDYRAGFERKGGKWTMTYFIAGD
jgi:hypothetical protein